MSFCPPLLWRTGCFPCFRNNGAHGLTLSIVLSPESPIVFLSFCLLFPIQCFHRVLVVIDNKQVMYPRCWDVGGAAGRDSKGMSTENRLHMKPYLGIDHHMCHAVPRGELLIKCECSRIKRLHGSGVAGWFDRYEPPSPMSTTNLSASLGLSPASLWDSWNSLYEHLVLIGH